MYNLCLCQCTVEAVCNCVYCNVCVCTAAVGLTNLVTLPWFLMIRPVVRLWPNASAGPCSVVMTSFFYNNFNRQKTQRKKTNLTEHLSELTTFLVPVGEVVGGGICHCCFQNISFRQTHFPLDWCSLVS